jgi:hypothetical protein
VIYGKLNSDLRLRKLPSGRLNIEKDSGDKTAGNDRAERKYGFAGATSGIEK